MKVAALYIGLFCSLLVASPRKEISVTEFLQDLDRNELEFFLDLATRRIGDLTNDKVVRDRLLVTVRKIIDSKKVDRRFPVLPPLHRARDFQGLLGGREAPAPEPEQQVEGNLAKLMKDAKTTYEAHDPTPVNKALPNIKYGHFTDRELPLKVVAQSVALARILTSLAADNGSQVIVGKMPARTPRDLFEGLLATGHKIEMRNERTYANFIALTRGEKYVRWPAWLDTGIPMKDGSSLVIPAGHSQHAWRISGPVVNARVMFFLGMYGVAFFPQIDERPQWTGFSVSYSTTSMKTILRAVELAQAYFTRIRTEGNRLPNHGYGYLGSCNDSNALLELGTRGTKTTYPWIRFPELNKETGGDQLDELFIALTPDTQTTDEALAPGKETRRATLLRILGMTPNTQVDKLLAKQLKECVAEVEKWPKRLPER